MPSAASAAPAFFQLAHVAESVVQQRNVVEAFAERRAFEAARATSGAPRRRGSSPLDGVVALDALENNIF